MQFPPTDLNGMTQATWNRLTPAQKAKLAEPLWSPQLVGLEGWRVEVVTTYGEKRRFIVGRSTGWMPIHLEIHNRRSTGGPPAEKTYASVRAIEKVR